MATVKLEHLSIFTTQLAAMVRSHLPLDVVLHNLAQETPNKILRYAVEDVKEDVRHGIDFSAALATHHKIFDGVYVSLIKAGMVSGRLDETLEQLATFLAKKEAIYQQVSAALSYPIIMIITFFGIFNAMVFLILPRFEKIFDTMGKELPALTQVVVDLGQLWRESWLNISIIVAAFVGVVTFFYVVYDGRYLWDRHKMKIPLFGNLWRMAAIVAFLKTLGIQLQHEVPILQALQLSASVSGNTYLAEAVLLITDDVERGSSLTDAFGRHTIFPGIVLQMVSAGEISGNLDDLILSSARYYESLLSIRIQTMTSLINPILTIAMGLAIGIMMVATFLPVFDLSSAVMK